MFEFLYQGVITVNLTYLLLFFELGFAFLFASLVVCEGLVALILELSDGISTITHVLDTQVECLVYPTEDAAKNHRILINLFLLH